jgi:hypothetical protein
MYTFEIHKNYLIIFFCSDFDYYLSKKNNLLDPNNNLPEEIKKNEKSLLVFNRKKKLLKIIYSDYFEIIFKNTIKFISSHCYYLSDHQIKIYSGKHLDILYKLLNINHYIFKLVFSKKFNNNKINLSKFNNITEIKCIDGTLIYLNNLPPRVNTIHLPHKYNNKMIPTNLNIDKLYLHKCNITSLSNVSVNTLYFSDDFNDKINLGDSKIKKIVFGKYFNQPIENLNNYVEEIILGYYFNNNLDYLPNGITCIKIKGIFDKELNNLPNSLKELYISSNHFNKSLDNLPQGLKILSLSPYETNECNSSGVHCYKIGPYFNQNIYKLPDSLETLHVYIKFFNQFQSLPKSIKKIILTHSHDVGLFSDLKIECFRNIPKLLFDHHNIVITNTNTNTNTSESLYACDIIHNGIVKSWSQANGEIICRSKLLVIRIHLFKEKIQLQNYINNGVKNYNCGYNYKITNDNKEIKEVNIEFKKLVFVE